MSSISSFEITNDVDPDSWILFSVAAFVPDVYFVNSNGIRTMLANISSTFFIKGNLVSNDGLRSLPRNSPDCTILESSNFDNCILADGLFEKSLGSFQTCL